MVFNINLCSQLLFYNKTKIMKKLDIIHNAGLRIAFETYRPSSVPSILIFAEIPPLRVRRLQISLK